MKELFQIAYRRTLYGIARTHQLRGHNATAFHRLILRPDFSSPAQMADVAARLSWYLPPDLDVHVVARAADPFTMEDAKTYRANSGHTYLPKWRDIEVVAPTEPLPASRHSLVLRWKNGAAAASQLISRRGALRFVDPDFLATSESNTYLRLLFHDLWTADQRAHYVAWSATQLQRLYESVEGQSASYVFGTGPSLSQAVEYNFDDGLRIACNSIVKSSSLMEHIRPNILVFADPVFHFGVSEYAERFREDMIAASRLCSPWLVVPLEYAPVLEANYPFLKDQLVPIDLRRSRRFNIPSQRQPWSRATQNVLTGAMLPLAVGSTQKVSILGCDGREQSDTGFWAHNSDAQYGDEYDTVRRLHPSFFRDRNYVRYYLEHCDTLASFLDWSELNSGTEFRSMTHSAIPALRKRGVP